MFESCPVWDRFIVIEGIDGAGTSTQRGLLRQALESAGRKVFDTWEPSEGPVGRLVRGALRGDIDLAPATIARLFAADRGEHLHGSGGIRATLDSGAWTLCDRYVLSSLAYQGQLLGDEAVWALNRDFPLPAWLVFIDVDAATGSRRRLQRGGVEEIYEKDDFQAAVRIAYHRHLDRLATERPELGLGRFDGGRPVAELHREICGFLGIRPIQ